MAGCCTAGVESSGSPGGGLLRTLPSARRTPLRGLIDMFQYGRPEGRACRSGPVPLAARSKKEVYGRSPAEILGSNPAGGMDVCLL